MNTIGWFEIYVKDIEKAKSFYQAVFTTSLEKLDLPDIEMWSFPMTSEGYGSGGALVKDDTMAQGTNSTVVYFNCNDCAIEASKVADNGGLLIQEKTSIGQYGFIALAKDPEGNLIGMHSQQ